MPNFISRFWNKTTQAAVAAWNRTTQAAVAAWNRTTQAAVAAWNLVVATTAGVPAVVAAAVGVTVTTLVRAAASIAAVYAAAGVTVGAAVFVATAPMTATAVAIAAAALCWVYRDLVGRGAGWVLDGLCMFLNGSAKMGEGASRQTSRCMDWTAEAVFRSGMAVRSGVQVTAVVAWAMWTALKTKVEIWRHGKTAWEAATEAPAALARLVFDVIGSMGWLHLVALSLVCYLAGFTVLGYLGFLLVVGFVIRPLALLLLAFLAGAAWSLSLKTA